MDLISRNDFSRAIQLNRWKLEPLSAPLMNLLQIDKVNQIHKSYGHLDANTYIDSVLKKLGIRFEIHPDDIQNIPKEGAFIAIANHPYGGLDGMILLHLLMKHRPDFKVMANFILKRIQPIEPHIIPVNPFEQKVSDKASIAGIKQLMEHIAHGNAAGIFPAGEVSAFRPELGKVSDSEWKPLVGRMIQKAQVPVLPIYFKGNNSALFNVLGMIHPHLRTAKLPSELFNKKGHVVQVRIGKAVSVKTIQCFHRSDEFMRYLRARTYALGTPVEVKRFFKPVFQAKSTQNIPILPAISKHLLRKEVEALRNTDKKILTHQHYEVYAVKHHHIPNLMLEIGRLREHTFRDVGEGSGKHCDLDEFDLHYYHLFAWDTQKEQIIGAYRMGLGKEIFRTHRQKGFYIQRLFKLKSGFNAYLQQSIELGRSFITKEYQSKHFSLFLLWKGIMEFAKIHPDHPYLIGPVSISNTYSTKSQSLMVSYIRKYHFDQQLASLVDARLKFKPIFKEHQVDSLMPEELKSIKNLEDLMAGIDQGNARIPILLKKYLNQNARIIGFNRDPEFSNVLDGLMLLDIRELPENTSDLLT